MATEILAHVGIPFATGLVLLLFIAAADRDPISWASCNDIALDLCILSVGACGGIFANATLIKRLGENTALYGILVVLCNMLCAGLLVYLRRWRKSTPGAWSGVTDLFLGLMTIALVVYTLRFA